MKKIFLILFACFLMLSFASCNNTQETEEESSVLVDENLLTVDITLNASFFDGMSKEEIVSAAKENGIINCVVKEDGSVVYTMTKAKHEELLEEMKVGIDETIDGLLNGEEEVASFVSIDYTEDLSVVDVKVDPALYSMWDSMYVLTFYISGAYYQSFAGVPSDEIDVIVNFINNDTQELLESASYKSYMANVSEAD